MKNLQAYLDQRNAMNKFFGGDIVEIGKIDAATKAKLLDDLDGKLSPENLCCDGELRGAALQKKARMLNGAVKELTALKV